MAKQTQPKTQTSDVPVATENVVNNPGNTQEVAKDAFGETQTSDAKIVAENQDSHNPYSKQNNDSEGIQEKSALPESKQILVPQLESPQETGTIQPTIQDEPIKPVLTDQVVYEDFSKDSTVKIKNDNGVTVKLSGTAAKILKNLDATTKIVK